MEKVKKGFYERKENDTVVFVEDANGKQNFYPNEDTKKEDKTETLKKDQVETKKKHTK